MKVAVLVIDVETNRRENGEVIQLAFVEAVWEGDQIETRGEPTGLLFKPNDPIEYGALAVHHILPSDLEGRQPSSEAASMLPACEYVVGHNVDFDADALGLPSSVNRICTLALARHLWPRYDSHNLTSLMYRILGANPETREFVRGAHDATVDVVACHVVLQALVKNAVLKAPGWDGLWEFSEAARIPSVMPFGKHKGMRIAEVPRDYKAWLLRQDDVDPYLRKALQ